MSKNVSVKTWQIGEDPSWIIDELTSISDKGENYRYESEHGVQQFIRNGILDSYSIIYRDGVMISGSGTRPSVQVPKYGDCYQIAVRGFRIPQPGLRQEYFTLDILTPLQITRGNQLGFTKCVMTFNLHNTRLVSNLDKNWNFPRTSIGTMNVNNVNQIVYLFN